MSDIGGFRPDGQEMSQEDWQVGFAKSLGVFLNGERLTAPEDDLRRPAGDTVEVKARSVVVLRRVR